VVDVHPGRPIFRGVDTGAFVASLEADPTFEELEAAGGTVVKKDEPHTVLDDMFLISGEVPRETEYEVGFPRGVRLDENGVWIKDELILDERFVVCNLKGMFSLTRLGTSTPLLYMCSCETPQERDS
jgi:7,8-dihydropterin-6-yl-methyl-4-(beta-D-ribofuranosyl)aminobenzene 5'-phosphate synthase